MDELLDNGKTMQVGASETSEKSIPGNLPELEARLNMAT